MADGRYRSAYTGTQIDTAINKALTQLDNNTKISQVAAKPATQTATLSSSSWSSNSITVSVTGVTSSNTVIVSPANKASADIWADSEVFCSAQGSGTLTFTCVTTPTSNISVSVVILS